MKRFARPRYLKPVSSRTYTRVPDLLFDKLSVYQETGCQGEVLMMRTSHHRGFVSDNDESAYCTHGARTYGNEELT